MVRLVGGIDSKKSGNNARTASQTMGWLRHIVRGLMAGAMKKAGYTVESFWPAAGERSCRLPK